MSSSPRHRVPENDPVRRPSGSGRSNRRIKLRLSLTVAAIAAVAAAVVPYAVTHTADTAAGAAQFSGAHHGHHSATVDSHRQQPKPSAAPTPTACPNSPTKASTLWSSSLQPKVASSSSDSAATLGVMVVPSKSGQITGIAFWKGSGNSGEHTASLWTDGKRLASGTFQKETASGWQWLTLAHPVQVKAGQHVLATYRAPEGHFAYTPGAITPGGVCSGALRATDGTLWTSHGKTGHHATSRTTNYFVNLRFVPTGAAPEPTQSPTGKPTVQPTAPKPTVQPTTTPTHSHTPTATPKPTPKPTTSAPPSTSTSGWPDASNTGVPAGTTLHSCSGSLNSSGTYDACEFSGGVTIGASNVHITRSLINGQVIAGDGKQTGLVISDTEINCHCMSTSTTTPPAVAFSNFTLLRDNIYNAGHGVQINNNAVVEDSYIHGLGANNGAHKDAIISNGGGNAVIKHNNLECAADSCSAAIGLFGDFAPIKNWTITGNLLNTTGGYCLYGGDASGGAKPYPTASGIVVTNNQFGKKDWPKCGQYGPVVYFGSHSGNQWSGNVWQGTSTPISQ